MSHRERSCPVSAMLLASTGVMLTGVGFYFLFLRPPLLPEDIRFLQVSAAEIARLPRLEHWLGQVFRVLGGFAMASGILTGALAATAFRERHPVAAAGALVGGASSIGLMAMVNFAINSDFKWLLLAAALTWAASMAAFVMEGWSSGAAGHAA